MAGTLTGLPATGVPLAKYYGTDDHILYGPYKSGRTFDFYAANLERKYGAEARSARQPQVVQPPQMGRRSIYRDGKCMIHGSRYERLPRAHLALVALERKTKSHALPASTWSASPTSRPPAPRPI